MCSSQEEKEPQPHENFRASFLRSRCVGPCLLPPGLCFFLFFFLQNNFHWKRESPCQCSVFNLFLLLYSIVRSWQLALGKHQIRHQTPVARASSCLPTLTNPAPTDAPSHHPANKKTKQNKSIKTSTSVKINNCGIKVGVFFFFPGWKLSGAQQHKQLRFLEVQRDFSDGLRRDVPRSRCAACEEKVETSGRRCFRARGGEV